MSLMNSIGRLLGFAQENLTSSRVTDETLVAALQADRASAAREMAETTTTISGQWGLWLPTGSVNQDGAAGRNRSGAIAWAVIPVWYPEARQLYACGLEWDFAKVYGPNTPAPFVQVHTYVRTVGMVARQLNAAFERARAFQAVRYDEFNHAEAAHAGDLLAINAAKAEAAAAQALRPGINGESPDHYRTTFAYVAGVGSGTVRRGRTKKGSDIIEIAVKEWIESPHLEHPRLLRLDAPWTSAALNQSASVQNRVLAAAGNHGLGVSAAEKVAMLDDAM